MASSTHTEATATAGQRRPLIGRFARDGSRAPASALAGAAACALLLALAWQSGGYFPDGHLEAGAIAFGVLALVLVLRPPGYAISGPTLLALGGLAGLAVWTGLSAGWSSVPDVALEDFQRTLVYVGLFGLGLVAAGSGRYSRHLVWAALGVAAAIVLAGLLHRLYPGTFGDAGAPDRFAGYRLGYPLSYWNAFGALAALVVVLATGLAADPRSPLVLRAPAAALAVPAGVAGYLSFSRGGWLALVVGVIVLLALGAHRLGLLATMAVVGGALVIAVLRVQAYPGLTDAPDLGAGQAAEGRAFAPLVLLLSVGAAAAQVVLARLRARRHTRDQAALLLRRFAPYIAGALLVAAVGGYLVTASTVEGGSARALDRADRWVSEQWDEFMAPATFSAVGAERLTTARGTRSDLYRVAIDGFEGHPLWGDGSGGFQVRFAYEREVGEKVRDAHSLYLETLGELGLVGLLLLLAFVGAIVWAAVSARLRPRALSRSQSAAVSAAVAVWVAHAMVDWDWQVPALTGTALVLAAALFPLGISSRRVHRAPKDAV